MAVTTFDGQFSFKQDSLARLGDRGAPKMNSQQYEAFQNSPFMQGVRKTEDLCWTFTTARDDKRKASDPSFEPTDEDFSAPKAHEFDRAINYYKVLGIDEYAPLDEVKKSYKKLSLVYHPDKTSGLSEDQKEEYAAIFIELKNAYLTLGDNPTRRQYDRERDRDKASFEVNGFKPKVRPHFDASEVLKKLQEMQRPPGKQVDIPVATKLEKFCYGGHKGIKRQKKVKDFGGFKHEMRIYRCDIPKGAKEPHEVTFRQGGDHHEDTRADTLTFKITSKPHPIVERKGPVDLALRSRVGLGLSTHLEPILWVESPVLNGKHLLLWGLNPFFGQRAAKGELQLRLKGQGLTSAGCLHLTLRAGLATRAGGATKAPTTSKTSFSSSVQRTAGDQIVVIAKHMQTEGQLWLRLPKDATIGDVREKIIKVTGLPRNATVRILQQITGGGGGFTPFPDKQPVGSIRSLNCAGNTWSGVTLTPATSKEFLQEVVAYSDTPLFQEKLALTPATRWQTEIFTSLASVLPEFGLEPTLSVMQERLAEALRQLQRLPTQDLAAGDWLAQKIKALQEPPKATESAGVSNAKDAETQERNSLKAFLKMHKLGPPGGFGYEAPTHGEGGICEAPALLRRLARQQQTEPRGEVVMTQMGEPMTLFTRPTCSVTFFSNLHQPPAMRSGQTIEHKLTFAVTICSPSCAKGKAAFEFEKLKANLVPLLRLTAFHMFKACREILPRSLANKPHQAAKDAETAELGPTPWKQLGDEAFKRSDFFTAQACYCRCLDETTAQERETDPRAVAAVYSNRAACFAKVGHYDASMADAKIALELAPEWGRAWSRLGLASSKLGQDREAVDAYKKAVTFDPSAANMEALLSCVKLLQPPNVDQAHVEKEAGNVALRGNEFGLAIACYTCGLALVPPEPQASVPGGVAPEDEHALLRSVLLSNRAGVRCRLKHWALAREDAQLAVDKKGDFTKARTRLGSALLGCGEIEKAYIQFAHALRHENNNAAALKGRQACIGIMPLWNSVPARRRSRNRFGEDLWRPRATTKVFCISDIHFDHKHNEDWAHRIDDFEFQEDVLIVAGNACDTRNALIRCLTTLKAKFRRVFYVPGNHELWLNPSEIDKCPDSLGKLLVLMETCDELGVDCFPSAISEDVFIVPMLSWYTAEFDDKDPFPDPNAQFDQQCKWPIDPETQVWKYMLKLNEAHLRKPYHGTVITFSHFLPSRNLPFAAHGRAVKAMGCEDLNEQVKGLKLRNRVHVYGHSHRHHCAYDEGILYVNHHHGLEGGREERAPIFMIHDGKAIVKKEHDIYSGPIRL
eukprot:TRINITY_DN26372_c0_g2_i1.p1 TRINITY_DN26372_c0_g2~~TRINITY_DN26372_c0_g2_i1.p1  ORF type:complete len:1307 (-),score=263.08 TRINITY_DN26372_c0_g2_i1:342-4262(-)